MVDSTGEECSFPKEVSMSRLVRAVSGVWCVVGGMVVVVIMWVVERWVWRVWRRGGKEVERRVVLG